MTHDYIDNETWLLDTADEIMISRAEIGFSAMASIERVIYCLWVADYGIRNAGDLSTAFDLFASFMSDGLVAAKEAGLPLSARMFSLPIADLEAIYLGLFDGIVDEIRAVQV
jgi:hypothetical protein